MAKELHETTVSMPPVFPQRTLDRFAVVCTAQTTGNTGDTEKTQEGRVVLARPVLPVFPVVAFSHPRKCKPI